MHCSTTSIILPTFHTNACHSSVIHLPAHLVTSAYRHPRHDDAVKVAAAMQEQSSAPSKRATLGFPKPVCTRIAAGSTRATVVKDGRCGQDTLHLLAVLGKLCPSPLAVATGIMHVHSGPHTCSLPPIAICVHRRRIAEGP